MSSLAADLFGQSHSLVKRFGLRHNPFSLTPDPRFLHRTKQAHKTLHLLTRGITERKGLVLLSGAPGTGKTTLLYTALEHIKGNPALKNELRTAVIVNSTLSTDELLEAVLDGFGVHCVAQSNQHRLELLLEMMLDVRRRDGTAVLVVDEAQLLSAELLDELLSLLNLQTSHESLLQVVLSGQPELEKRLEKIATCRQQKQAAVRCETIPLSLEETRDYIQHRLSIAGARGKPIFQYDAVEAVYLHSGGIPRTVNLLCGDALVIADLDGLQQVSFEMIQAAAKTLLSDVRPCPTFLHDFRSTNILNPDLIARPSLPNQESFDSTSARPPRVISRPRTFESPAPSTGSRDQLSHHVSRSFRRWTRQLDHWCATNFKRKRCRVLSTELGLAGALLLGTAQAMTYGEPWPHFARATCGFAGLVLTAVVAGLGTFLLIDALPERPTIIKFLLKAFTSETLARKIRR